MSSYLATPGAEIRGVEAAGRAPLLIAAGTCLALSGRDAFRKHFFCDWILGFVDVPGSDLRIRVGEQSVESAKERNKLAAVLGRSPLLYGETIQENLLYRTQGVRKQDLYGLIERLYGPGLRARTSAQNPLTDPNGKPVPIHLLTSREHVEIAQINVLLQRAPLVVLDLSSRLMDEALGEGFRPCPDLFDSGKTVLVILPPERDLAWAESTLGRAMTASLRFD